MSQENIAAFDIPSTIAYCRNFPAPPAKAIPRDHFIEEIRRTLDGKADIVLIVGDSISGKSELNAEYFRRHTDNCIGIFLGSDNFSRSKEYIQLTVAEQITWIVEGKSLNVDTISDDEYQRKIYKLQKHAKQSQISWLIDGISDAIANPLSEKLDILDLLPLSTREFKFIITSESDISKELQKSKRSIKCMDIMLVSPDEARSFLCDLIDDEAEIQDMRMFCQSSVGRLQKVRTLLIEGHSLGDMLWTKNESLHALLEFEWSTIAMTDPLKKIIATVVFSDRQLSAHDISVHAQIPLDETYNLINKSKFLNLVSRQGNEIVTIDSQTQRIFAAKKLEGMEHGVRDRTIALLLSTANTAQKTRYLPGQLAKAGRDAELINNLNAQHFIHLLETEQTLRSLRLHAEYGRISASKIGDLSLEIAYSLLTSTVTGLTFSVGTEEQLQALTRLGRHEEALEIAAIAPTTEERFHLLAKALSGFGDKGLPISDELKLQITDLYEQIDPKSLGDLGIEIACNLLSVDFKLANALINRVIVASREDATILADKKSDKKPSTDSIFAAKDGSAASKRSGEIPDHKLERFWRESSRRVERLKADVLISRASVENPSFGLMLCKHWLATNAESIEAGKVVDAALDFFLANSETAPQIKDLRILADVLPSINDRSEQLRLCSRLQTQYRVLGHHGTTVESVRMRMLLLRSQYLDAMQDTELELMNVFFEIQSIADISTQATCWAWMLDNLSRFPNKALLEKQTDLSSLVADELQKTIDKLLQSSADHFKAARDAVQAIAQTNPEKAFNLISKLNTVAARDLGYEELARALLPTHETTAELIVRAIDSIQKGSRRNYLCAELLLRLRHEKYALDAKRINTSLLGIWTKVSTSVYKFQAAIIAVAFHFEAGRHEEAMQLNNTAKDIWASTSTEYLKVELGHLAASELADANRDVASEWISLTHQHTKQRPISSAAVGQAIFFSLKLATRLFPVITSPGTSILQCNEFRRFDHLTKRIPSLEFQLRLWCDLSIRLHFSSNTGASKEIAESRISEILDGDFQFNELMQALFVTEAAPALYLAHQSSAIHRIDRLNSTLLRDEARRNIALVLFQKTPLREPFNSIRDAEYSLDANTTSDIASIVKLCKTDSIIFDIVDDLCRSMTSDKNKSKIQRNAVLDHINSLEEFVEKALPDPNNIKHEGFKIVSLAVLRSARLKIQSEALPTSTQKWNRLYMMARSITNVADRSVVTAIVGANARVAEGSPVCNWIADIRMDLESIPSNFDKLDRFEWIARIVEPKDKAAARAFLADGMTISSYLPASTDVMKQQRSILDFAHMLDPKMATTLLDKFDTDEARKGTLRKRLETNEKSKAIASRSDPLDIDDIDNEQLAAVCYDNLGRLIAGRINARQIPEFKELIARARLIPIDESSPIWDFLFENAVRKRNLSNREPDSFCRKLFDATCMAAEITQGLVGKLIDNSASSSTSNMIRPGDRDLFLSKITNWAAQNDGSIIYLSDPYFSPGDIELLRILSQVAPRSKFRILTSKEQIRKKKISSPEDSFLDAWQEKFDFEPPTVDFAIVGYGPEGKHPIHDRWVVAPRSGLRIGSSVNSIGFSRVSDVSEMSAVDAIEKGKEIEQYFDSPPKSHAGERLSVSLFRWT